MNQRALYRHPLFVVCVTALLGGTGFLVKRFFFKEVPVHKSEQEIGAISVSEKRGANASSTTRSSSTIENHAPVIQSIQTVGQVGNNMIITSMSRDLSVVQRVVLKNLLTKEHGKVGFLIKMLDGEAKNYAEKLAGAFAEAGWIVLPMNVTLLDDFDGKINVFVTSSKSDSDTTITYGITPPFLEQASILYESVQPRIGSFSAAHIQFTSATCG